ncbi:AprI/Inh family metalloprotease inhibitor [Sedimentitalea todarodis]|uniref:AprI/Inh family metalloprotease inhibitor n=1 Tax=Sedimentitalea todarodis TaxID=1631240 RepID=A0ABU3VC48_9RHOB|nr:AprI/Inh family metalloprotease inhibitor [Sedimentitalea todarodis]MDU9003755.1 AprI/Inh family metalloprotease inhibitor [Sedimentitalea todarodis]
MLVVTGFAVAACNMATPTSDTQQQAVPPSQGIAGEWRLQAEDSLSWCRFVIDPSDTGKGRAADYGCIDLDGFAGFVRRWEREDGQIVFYSATNDGPVARVRRDGPDILRGNLVPSGRKIVMTRR